MTSFAPTKTKKRALPNVIKLENTRVQKMCSGIFFQKRDIFSKKDLTKRQKSAVDFISSLIKSPLVNRGKSNIDKEEAMNYKPNISILCRIFAN